MNEQDLHERLVAATTRNPQPVPVQDDVARGRRSRRRHTASVTGAVLATVAVVGGVSALAVVALPRGEGVERAPLGVAHPGPQGPSARHQHLPTALVGGRIPVSGHHVGQPRHADAPESYPYQEWLTGLYLLARQDLDPAHQYTSYSLNEQASSWSSGMQRLGTRVTWQQSGEAGEGVVGVAVATAGTPPEPEECLPYGGCRNEHDSQFGDYRIGGDPNGRDGFIVIVTQDDGEIATVSVDPVFGNNTDIATQAPLPSIEQVLTLATEPSLDLPAG